MKNMFFITIVFCCTIQGLLALCEFSDDQVCVACEGTEVQCNTAINNHCDLKDWNEAACKAARVGCPFEWVFREGDLPSSPCTQTACNGALPDHAACLEAVGAYCAYEFVLANSLGSTHTVDTACLQYVPPGCSSGSVHDCNGNCVQLSSLGDGTCDENAECEKLNFDGGDCIPPTPSVSPTAAPSPRRCCAAINVHCCSCEQEETRHRFCTNCRAGRSEATADCCGTCPVLPHETKLQVQMSFAGQTLEAFTPEVRKGVRVAFAELVTQPGEFTVNYTDVALTLTEIGTKQTGVSADVEVTLPSEGAAEDAIDVLQDTSNVLSEVNEAIAQEGGTLVLGDVSFQNATSVVQPLPSSDDGEDVALIVCLVLLFVVVLPCCAIGGYFGYKKYEEGKLSEETQPPLAKQSSAQAILVKSPAVSKKPTAATEDDFM